MFSGGRVPYPELTNSETIKKVLEGHRLPKPEKCSEKLYDLMLKCWNNKAEKRPNFRQIQINLVEIFESEGGMFKDHLLLNSSSDRELPASNYSEIGSSELEKKNLKEEENTYGFSNV